MRRRRLGLTRVEIRASPISEWRGAEITKIEDGWVYLWFVGSGHHKMTTDYLLQLLDRGDARGRFEMREE